MTIFFIFVTYLAFFRSLLFVPYILPVSSHTIQKRGITRKSTPTREEGSNQQQQPVSFGSFQGLLELDPNELMMSFEIENDDAVTSHFTHNHNSNHHNPAPSQLRNKTVLQPLSQSEKCKRRADEYNLKRRLNRAEKKAKDPIAYKQELEVEAERNRFRRKVRKKLGIKPYPSTTSTTKKRAEIRKRVRENKGTEKDHEYLEHLRIKNKEYRSRKKWEKVQSGTYG